MADNAAGEMVSDSSDDDFKIVRRQKTTAKRKVVNSDSDSVGSIASPSPRKKIIGLKRTPVQVGVQKEKKNTDSDSDATTVAEDDSKKVTTEELSEDLFGAIPDDDLLSLSSQDTSPKKYHTAAEDVDSDETVFDGYSPIRPSEKESTEVESKENCGSDSVGIDDGQQPSTSKNFNPVQSHVTDDSTDDEDIPLPFSHRLKSNSAAAAKKRDTWNWNEHSDSDGEFGHSKHRAYDPLSVTKETWHGDVQRTVTMLKDTLAEMPTPVEDGGEEVDIKLPPGLVSLYPHQKYAVKWMQWREGQFPGGGILADEMGLGKTIEVISLIMKARWDCKRSGKQYKATVEEAGRLLPSKTTLLVCPLSCIPQWEREIQEKGSDIRVYIYHGSKKNISAYELSGYDVILTTYMTVGNEIPKRPPPNSDIPPKPCRSPLKRIYWMRIVLDEAHQIRNPKTKAADALCQLEARHRWAVTGTPIHNKPEDFYSMCAFLRLKPFDERSVWDYWIGLRSVRKGTEQRLHVLGKALILRRTKQEVADAGGKIKAIPPKEVDIVHVQLTAEERALYDDLLGYAQSILKEFLSQKEQRDHGLGMGGLIYAGNKVSERQSNLPGPVKYSHIFALLMRLRQLAVLPFLISAAFNVDELDDEAEDINLEEKLQTKKKHIMDRNYESSKIIQVLKDVDELRDVAAQEGRPMDKIIIVSSWTTTLDILFEHLVKKNYTAVFITGRDDMSVRMANQDRFNRGKRKPQILLLSLLAGGVGLNLTGANHVFFLEPHWNPQHELQAQDRVHRFGQTKNVFIKRYIAEETIETRIMELQQTKRDLADGLLNNTKRGRGAGISLDQMKRLFDL